MHSIKKIYLNFILIILINFILISCATVPLTGRRQVLLLSEEDEIQLGEEAYTQVLETAKLSKDSSKISLVEKVGKNIAKVVNKKNYKWEFKVIQDDNTVNAFALPGGKVAVYTGIFPLTKDETGMAVVLGHEIAHAVARHGGERISEQALVEKGIDTLLALMKGRNVETSNAIRGAFGIGATVGILLPFSRKHESEADHIGLIYMAKAGYDPREALNFWKRMASLNKGNTPPQILSTHPSDEKRIKQIEEWLPEALKYYKKGK